MADLDKSYRQDDETEPIGQNERLAQLLATIWFDYDIHRVERMEKVDPDSPRTGWRIHYEKPS